MNSVETVVVLIAGFVLDCLLGDPASGFHPIVLIGKTISWLEQKLRTFFPIDAKGERIAGLILAIITPGFLGMASWGLLIFLGKISIYLKIAVEIILCWLILSARTLAKEADAVFGRVMEGDLEGARARVGRIVGRDTGSLSLKEVIKACVETVAESTSDGVIAPMIFIAVGGIPGGIVYKTINTLDSMVGYKNEKYLYFGTASARLDDLANFIPARITAWLMICAAAILKLDWKNALRIWVRDRWKHLSPNSGNPEAACAGALRIQLGGDAFYFGKKYEKATLGDAIREPEAGDIKRAISLMYVASILCLLIIVAIMLVTFFVGLPR